MGIQIKHSKTYFLNRYLTQSFIHLLGIILNIEASRHETWRDNTVTDNTKPEPAEVLQCGNEGPKTTDRPKVRSN